MAHGTPTPDALSTPAAQPTPWPCREYGTGLGYQHCPGDGYARTHCTACHHVYLGYVTLCPVHQAAAALLDAAKGVLCLCRDGTDSGDAAFDRLDDAIAKAEGRS